MPCEDHRDEACPNCRGDGKALRFACPRRLRAAWTDPVIDAYEMLSQHSILPDAGGYLDQAAWTIHAFRIIRDEVSEASHAPRERRKAP